MAKAQNDRSLLMPILKYKCQACGKEFAKILLNPDSAAKSCPVCGAEELVESGAAFHQDRSSAERMMSISCDSCGDNMCGVAPSS